MCFGGGGTTQTTNSNSSAAESGNSLQSFLDQLASQVNTSQTQNQTEQQSGTSGATVAGNELQGLTGSQGGSAVGTPDSVLGFFQNEQANGLDPAVINNANANYETTSQRGINDALNNAAPGTNTAGLAEDLQRQQTEGLASLGSSLAAQNQGVKAQGAAGTAQTLAQANPLTNFSNNQAAGTNSATGTTNTNTSTGGTQVGATNSAGTQTGNQTTNTTTQPSFGGLLGSLLSMYAGAATGGAAGAGGLGSILGGL